MPQLGESIAEATIVRIVVPAGDSVEADQDIIEVETNKAVMEVTAPCDGKIVEFTAEVDKSYPVGATLGYIEVSAEDAERMGVVEEKKPANQAERLRRNVASADEPRKVEPTVSGLPVPAPAGGASYLSPRMKARKKIRIQKLPLPRNPPHRNLRLRIVNPRTQQAILPILDGDHLTVLRSPKGLQNFRRIHPVMPAQDICARTNHDSRHPPS